MHELEEWIAVPQSDATGSVEPAPNVATPGLGMARRLTSAEAAELAAQSDLIEMGVRPALRRYIGRVWDRRSFIWNLSASRAYAKNQGSYLGQAWTVLRPILDAATFIIIFGFVFSDSGRGIENRAAFIVVGTFTYALFQSAVVGGISSIPNNLALIRSHRFPRAVVPLSTAMTETVLFGPVLASMIVLVLVTGLFPGMEHVVPAWSWLLLPLAALLIAVFSTGVALAFARLGARTPDVANVVPFLLSLGRFASGVMFFIPAMVDRDNALLPFLMHQPVQIFLELFRSVFGNETVIPMTWQLWAQAAAWAIGSFALGFLFFWRAEETYGRD